MVIPDTFEPEKWMDKKEEAKPLITLQEKVETLKTIQKDYKDMTQMEKLNYRTASMLAEIQSLQS